jgi:3-isopropylmalate dehydrogenase
MIQGGLGIAASANIHPGQVSLFEPVHGSFPEAAGKNTASPIAAILAGSMMLDFLGEQEASNAIETTVIDLFTSRRLKGVRAADHPTNEVGELVVAEVRRLGTPA